MPRTSGCAPRSLPMDASRNGSDAHPPMRGFRGTATAGSVYATSRRARGRSGATRSEPDQTRPWPTAIRDRLGPATNPELGVEVGEVGLDGAGADEEGVGDLGVGEPTRQEAQHLHLARRQTGGIALRRWLRSEPRRERVDACQRRRRAERAADAADLVQEGADLVGSAGRQAQLGQGQQRERPFEGRITGGGEVEGGREVRLGRRAVLRLPSRSRRGGGGRPDAPAAGPAWLASARASAAAARARAMSPAARW